MAAADSKLVLNRRRWRILAMTLLVAMAPGVRAQDTDRDPPARAARVVDVVGDAWLFDHESREWLRLTRNQTVAEGDRVRTDERGRVSLRVGSTTIWMDERSDLELSQLDEGQTLLQLDRGDVALRLRSVQNAMETRLRTREGTSQPEREGLYRVEQLDRGSKAYVYQGRLRFDWAQAASPVTLGTGEQSEFWWPDGPRAERGPLFSDGFGDWVLAENREEGERPVARYVSPEMTGAEDLDRYGAWDNSPDYGPVWMPTTLVVADWAPYRYGRWAWSRHWGWTWVDDAPWGFAPFHYGRWVSWRGRWCWAPGPYVQRPVYAPALVGWVGGPAVSVGITIGSRPPPPRFGWYPLAPREVFVPGYHHSPRYVSRVNDPRDLRDPVTVQRPHRYRDTPGAVSTLPAPGAGIQPLPVRGPDRKPEPGWGRPLPGAPGRGDLAAVLPAAPTRPPEADQPRRGRPPEGNMGWRSDNQGPPRRGEPRRGPDVSQPQAPAAQQPQPGLPLVQQPQQPQPPQTGQAAQPQPRPNGPQPQRGGDNVPWRGQPREEQQRQMQQQEAQQREAQQRQAQQREAQQREMQQREMQQREAQQREAQQRDMQQRREEMMQRREEQQLRTDQVPRRMEPPQRQPEPQRMQMPQQQQPQAQPQRGEGPQRGRQDGPQRPDRAERRGDPKNDK